MRVALFPLSTVLFPQGVLPLRVFEARYLDMVRDCMREGTLFGVCLITDSRASEVSRTTALAEVGCLARIDAWDMKQLGLLHIRAVGQDRFRLLSTETQADGLVLGDVELIDPDEDAPVPPEHRPCVELLSRILDDLRTQYDERRIAEDAPDQDDALAQLPFAEPFHMESSAWVSNRLCEVLPVPLKAKQRLMELTDAPTRLQIVHTYLKQHLADLTQPSPHCIGAAASPARATRRPKCVGFEPLRRRGCGPQRASNGRHPRTHHEAVVREFVPQLGQAPFRSTCSAYRSAIAHLVVRRPPRHRTREGHEPPQMPLRQQSPATLRGHDEQDERSPGAQRPCRRIRNCPIRPRPCHATVTATAIAARGAPARATSHQGPSSCM